VLKKISFKTSLAILVGPELLVKIVNTALSTCSDLFGYSRQFGLGVSAITDKKVATYLALWQIEISPKIKRKRWLAN